MNQYTILFSAIINIVFSANILFISPIESVSHNIWNEVLIRELLIKGHNITLLGHKDIKITSENYTVYRITGFEDMYSDSDYGNEYSNPFMDLINIWHSLMITSAKIHLKSNALKIILDYPRDKFDLIIFDLICGHEFYPLIEHFDNPPVVGISPFSLPPYILDAMGSHFYSYNPIYTSAYTENMTFLQRAENTLLNFLDYFLKWYHMPTIYKMAQERYGKSISTFDKIERRIGILLANYDPVLEYAQSIPPNIIPVGGMHVRRQETLPNDLQEILNKSNDGVIFFSLGTVVQPTWLPTKVKKILLKAFSKLNQTILWKYTANDLTNIPKNVIIRKWYPQNNVLEHKNVQLFITHCGALGSHETMYHGVPVLGIPFFADQKLIAEKMTARMLGKKLLISEMNEDILYTTILELIKNPIYKRNMKKISQMFRDQKESPLERATFWVEYALRNKDLSHLSIKARDMTLFQRENLDIYGVILLFVLVVFILLFVIIKNIITNFIFKKKYKIKRN